MITGAVNAYLEGIIRLVVHGPHGQTQQIQALIDSGFNGTLSLPSALIAAMGLPYRRRGRAILADGSQHFFDVVEAVVIWDGQPIRIPVYTADTDPLVGMELLRGYELRMQIVEGGRVTIEALP